MKEFVVKCKRCGANTDVTITNPEPIDVSLDKKKIEGKWVTTVSLVCNECGNKEVITE